MHPVERRYSGICTIYQSQKTTGSETNITTMADTAICTDQPCRKAVKSVPVTGNKNGAPAVVKVVTLYLSPSITVNPGSKAVVTQEGQTEYYKCSGVAAVYPSHQEITLEKTERWA